MKKKTKEVFPPILKKIDMKIAFLSRYQGKLHRGAENFVSEIASRLSKKHQVKILVGKEADSLIKVLEGKFDMVIPVNGRLQAIKVSWGRFLGSYKVLITGHSGKGWDDILNIVLAKPDIFVALTDYLAEWVKKWAWGSKVVKISNGVDLVKFNPAGEKIDLGFKKPIILSVGALTWYKRHERVIRALGELNFGSLLIAGEGPERKSLEKLGNKLGKRFKIANFDYEDMPKVYRSCDLFTLPSWDREAFGLVYLEAMASGLGVVAPDDMSRQEIVGDGGLLTDVSNPKKYAQAIKDVLARDLSKKARSQAEKFSWDKIVKDYEKIILT